MHSVGGINSVIVGFFTMVNDATSRNKYLNAQRRFFSRFHVYRDFVPVQDFYHEMVFDLWCWW